jgi:hypothetical protein
MPVFIAIFNADLDGIPAVGFLSLPLFRIALE